MTPAEKLSIHAGTRLWFEPTEWMRVLGPLPHGVTMTGDFAAATVAVMFASHPNSVRWLVRRFGTVLGIPPMLWIAYPAHGLPTFNRASLQQAARGPSTRGGRRDPARRRLVGGPRPTGGAGTPSARRSRALSPRRRSSASDAGGSVARQSTAASTTARISSPYFSSFCGPMPFTRRKAARLRGRASAMAASVESCAMTNAGIPSAFARSKRH